MVASIDTTLTRISAWINGELRGTDAEICGVTTDSRSVAPGNLFVALHGPNHDGHDHILDAEKGGVKAALVERPLDSGLAQIVVPDTRLALGALAAAWRRELAIPLVAVTGSNGKTTVKEMIAAILATSGQVTATRGNLNNDIGVPLTLLSLSSQDRFAVVEMGANHAGEITYLTSLARPQVAIITNAAAAHLEGFGSLEGVARAKGEIFEGLDVSGVAVINADDDFAPLWSELAAPHRILRFGMEQEADVSGIWYGDITGGRLNVTWNDEAFDINLVMPGRHNAYNALAAISAALALDIQPQDIVRGLESMQPVNGRLRSASGINGSRIIDDSYNANPASLTAGLEVLAACSGRRYLALGDMAELGETADELHDQAGRQAREMGIDRLYSVGRMSRLAADAFGDNGYHFDEQEALISALRPELAADVTLLVKGSRSSHMEQVVEALTSGGEI